METLVYRVVGLLFFLFLVTACMPVTPQPASPTPHLAYQVGGCQKSVPPERFNEWEGVDIQVEDGTIHVVDHLPYVCCATIEVEMQVEDGRVQLVERNVGDVCRCMCAYRVDMRVTSLPPGTYIIQVWGVEDERTGPTRLRGEKEVTITK